jgi:hypothetical protein
MTKRRRPTNDERMALIVDALPDRLSCDEAADIALLARALGDPSVWGATSRELEDRVVDAVLDAHPSSLSPVPAIDAAADAPSPATAPRRRRPRRMRMLVSAAAVFAAIAIGAGFITARHEPEAEFRSNLTATQLAPTARGAVDMYRTDAGFRIELHATGLPTLTGDTFYQGWLRNANGIDVPIGTFSSSAGEVTLWSGVSPKDYPTVTVTIETAGHNQLPSGRRVFVGNVEGS